MEQILGKLEDLEEAVLDAGARVDLAEQEIGAAHYYLSCTERVLAQAKEDSEEAINALIALAEIIGPVVTIAENKGLPLDYLGDLMSDESSAVIEAEGKLNLAHIDHGEAQGFVWQTGQDLLEAEEDLAMAENDLEEYAEIVLLSVVLALYLSASITDLFLLAIEGDPLAMEFLALRLLDPFELAMAAVEGNPIAIIIILAELSAEGYGDDGENGLDWQICDPMGDEFYWGEFDPLEELFDLGDDFGDPYYTGGYGVTGAG